MFMKWSRACLLFTVLVVVKEEQKSALVEPADGRHDEICRLAALASVLVDFPILLLLQFVHLHFSLVTAIALETADAFIHVYETSERISDASSFHQKPPKTASSTRLQTASARALKLSTSAQTDPKQPFTYLKST